MSLSTKRQGATNDCGTSLAAASTPVVSGACTRSRPRWSHPQSTWYLVAGALVPYKRVDLAIEACRALGRPLKVIGTGSHAAGIRALGHAEFLGWQPDEVVRDHYRRCRGLLFPGEEDFGIVSVEAQLCGAPVVALAQGGALDTVTPETGVLYEGSLEEGIGTFEAKSFDPEACRRNGLRFTRAVHMKAIREFVESALV